MASLTYEEERKKIIEESRRKKRWILLATLGVSIVLIAAFILVCMFWLNYIGFSLVVFLVLIGLTVKLGGQGVANVNKLQKHRLELLDENSPSGRFKWE